MVVIAVDGAITDATLIIKPEVAEPEGRQPSDSSDDPAPGHGPGLLSPDAPDHMNCTGVARMNSERSGRDFTRISQEILQRLSVKESVDLNTTVEIRACKSDGFSEGKVRVILENANALKFEQSTSESD